MGGAAERSFPRIPFLLVTPPPFFFFSITILRNEVDMKYLEKEGNYYRFDERTFRLWRIDGTEVKMKGQATVIRTNATTISAVDFYARARREEKRIGR
jgi:hypothetical protein